jgi:hypothetical protein
MFRKIFLVALFAVATLQAATYSNLSGALKQVLPAGQKAYKSKLVITEAQADALNAFGNGDFLEGDEFDVYYTKDDKGQVSGVAVQILEVLTRWKSNHTWVIGLAPDGKVSGLVILELFDKYALPLADAKFQKQFAGKDPAQTAPGKGMDAIAGASESCRLLSSSFKRAAYIASHTTLP